MNVSSVASGILSYALKPLLYGFTRLLPKDETIWLFTADSSGRFAENPKYLYLYASDRDEIRPIWLARSDRTETDLKREGYETYRAKSLRGIYFLLRAEYLFISHYLDDLWEYTGGTTVVQLWHGTPFKYIGKDTGTHPNVLTELFHRRVRTNWQYLITPNSGRSLDAFTSAFELDEDQMLVTGYPRNDVLTRDIPGSDIGSDSQSMDDAMEASKKSTTAMYMPTYRVSEKYYADDLTKIDEQLLDIPQLAELMANHDAQFLIKCHPHADGQLDIDSDRIRVVAEQADVYPLLKHVDILITDYSSVYFDYLLLDRPIIFYPYDLAEYQEKRGLYYEYDEVTPGPSVETPAQLNEQLEYFLGGDDGFERERKTTRDEFWSDPGSRASEAIYRTFLGMSRGEPVEKKEGR